MDGINTKLEKLMKLMKSIHYTNANNDVVVIELQDETITAVWLFGCNIIHRLTEQQLHYVASLVQ